MPLTELTTSNVDTKLHAKSSNHRNAPVLSAHRGFSGCVSNASAHMHMYPHTESSPCERIIQASTKTRHAVTMATACHGISRKKTSQCTSTTVIVARAQSPTTGTYVVTIKKSELSVADLSREDIMSIPRAKYAIFNIQNIVGVLGNSRE